MRCRRVDRGKPTIFANPKAIVLEMAQRLNSKSHMAAATRLDI